METTFKDIVKFCQDNDINLNKVVSFHEIWGDEKTQYEADYDKFEEKFGTVKVEIDERTMEHDTSLLVVSIGTDNDRLYFGGYGSYASYEGSDYDYMTVEEMQPYQKVITDWKKV